MARSAVNEFITRSFVSPEGCIRDYVTDQLLPYLLSLLHSVFYTLHDANAKVSLSAAEVIRSRTKEAVLEQSSKAISQRLENMERLPRSLIAEYVEGNSPNCILLF